MMFLLTNEPLNRTETGLSFDVLYPVNSLREEPSGVADAKEESHRAVSGVLQGEVTRPQSL